MPAVKPMVMSTLTPHPGEILAEEYLIPLGISIKEAAESMGLERRYVRDIINGKRPIRIDEALRLGMYLHNGARFWLNLQENYDIAQIIKRNDDSLKAVKGFHTTVVRANVTPIHTSYLARL